jgi:hypothetical protein
LGVTLDVTNVASVDVGAVLAAAPATAVDAPLAQVWLDGQSPTSATLYLIPRRADRVLARRIELPSGFDEVTLAQIVYLVERSAAALLASQPVGVPKAELDPSLLARDATSPPVAEVPPFAPVAAPETADRPPPAVATPPAAVPPAAVSPETPHVDTHAVAVAPATPTARVGHVAEPPRARSSFQVGGFVGTEAWASGHWLVPETGLVVSAERVRGRTRVGAALDGGLRRSVVADTADGAVSVSGSSTHLGLTLGRSFGARGIGRVSIGPGVDVNDAQVTPSIAKGTVTARPRSDVDWNLDVMLRWDVPLGARYGVFVAAGADVSFVTPRYTAVIDGTSTPLLTMWPVRPTVRVGLALGGR